MTSAFEIPFAALATARCPGYAAMLAAVEREFRHVHGDAVDAVLDDLARHLFGKAGVAAEEQVVAIAAAAWTALPDEGEEPEDWFLDAALSNGRASGAPRAALAAEIGRRAGIAARVARLRGCWAVHVMSAGTGVAADVGADPADDEDRVTGDICAHQLAAAVLTGFGAAAGRAGRAVAARRAGELRCLLP